MLIENSNIRLYTSHSFTEKHEKKEYLKAWKGMERPDFEGLKSSSVLQPKIDQVNFSEAAKAAQPQEGPASNTFEPSENDKIKILLIEKLVEALTGKQVKLKILGVSSQGSDNNNFKNPAKAEGPPQPAKKGWGIEYDYHEAHYEHENMSFSAEGIIKTKDGKEIKFRTNLLMDREFLAQKNLSIREGDAIKIDPLVINFDATAAQLTAAKFSFDLNADGKKEKISFAGPGSGFLALDINYDGVINDGKELFGPQSGKGFAELARYDNDNNGWIDEKDFVFNRLRIWTKDASGKDTLSSLKDRNIGAIYLGNMAGQFEIKNNENRSLGEVKSSGVFLKENGAAGTIQQIDLMV